MVFTEIQATLELPAAMSWSSIVTIDIRPEEDPQCRFEGHHGPEAVRVMRRSARLFDERQGRGTVAPAPTALAVTPRVSWPLACWMPTTAAVTVVTVTVRISPQQRRPSGRRPVR